METFSLSSVVKVHAVHIIGMRKGEFLLYFKAFDLGWKVYFNLKVFQGFYPAVLDQVIIFICAYHLYHHKMTVLSFFLLR